MKRLMMLGALILALGLTRSGDALAQGDLLVSVDGLQSEEHPRLILTTTVRSQQGVPVPDLGPDDFVIVEDMGSSFPPDEVETRFNPDATISVMLAIDLSGSMRGRHIEEAVRVANEFIDRLNERDRVGVIAFANTVDVDPEYLEEGKELDFTRDKNAARNVLNFLSGMVEPDADTPLYDAIFKAAALTAGEPIGKRAIIVMTDGREDGDRQRGTGSLLTGIDAIDKARDSGIPVYTVGLGQDIDSKYLQRLALTTGGEYQEDPSSDELSAFFSGVLDDLKQQYVLTFDTTLPFDSQPHNLLVRARRPSGEAGFSEYTFKFEGAPTPTPLPEAEPTVEQVVSAPDTVVPQEQVTASVPGTAAEPDSEPGSSGILQSLRDTVEEMMDDSPILLVGIGVGLLILIGLIIALVIVLVRGRRQARQEEQVDASFEEPYAPEADWPTGAPTGAPTPSATPRTEAPDFAGTEAAPFGWGPADPAAAPFAQAPFAQPPGPAGGPRADQRVQEDEIPVAGQTQLIQRASRHIGRLVNRQDPDHKIRISSTMNVGRSEDNQIVISHPTVSRRHAWVREEEGSWLVFDIGSANGTFVNDQRVTEPYPLSHGDVVRFGHAEFDFEVL